MLVQLKLIPGLEYLQLQFKIYHMKKMHLLPVVLLPILLTASISAEYKTPEENEIMQVLDTQVQAWNEGNLELFMQTYWNSGELTYFSGNRPHRGWTELLARYRKTYQSKESEMGTLSFTDIEICLLGSDIALARGKWHLERQSLNDISGLYTLILKKFPDGWKIIHDHSSS